MQLTVCKVSEKEEEKKKSIYIQVNASDLRRRFLASNLFSMRLVIKASPVAHIVVYRTHIRSYVEIDNKITVSMVLIA